MTALLIITHADFGQGLLNAAEAILGEVPEAAAISISRQDSPEKIRERLGELLQKFDTQTDGAILLTDMFGGTPTNLSMDFLEPGVVEIVTGVNLPMVLKFFGSRGKLTVYDLATLLQKYGRDTICLPSDLIRTK